MRTIGDTRLEQFMYPHDGVYDAKTSFTPWRCCACRFKRCRRCRAGRSFIGLPIQAGGFHAVDGSLYLYHRFLLGQAGVFAS